MTAKERAARRVCPHNRARSHMRAAAFWSTQDNYSMGALVAGIIIAITFGLMFVHAAVVL